MLLPAVENGLHTIAWNMIFLILHTRAQV